MNKAIKKLKKGKQPVHDKIAGEMVKQMENEGNRYFSKRSTKFRENKHIKNAN